jgi:hypothetical protein
LDHEHGHQERAEDGRRRRKPVMEKDDRERPLAREADD